MTVVEVPGSKSITNRALFLAAASQGTTTLRKPLNSDDTEGFADGPRIAMAFSITGLRIPGIVLDAPDCVKKTFPGFHQALAGLTAAWA